MLDVDTDTLSMSVAVDFDKLEEASEAYDLKMKPTKQPREFIFVTEDGKTAEPFEEHGKNDFVILHSFNVRLTTVSFAEEKPHSPVEIQDMPSSPPSSPSSSDSSHAKPKMSYAQLIAEALMTDSNRMLTLNEIYIAINKQHPFYSLDASTGRNWQNAIRCIFHSFHCSITSHASLFGTFIIVKPDLKQACTAFKLCNLACEIS